MKVTLKDIADRANVSISSVSRALSKSQTTAPIHDQTRSRIIQAARELGYRRWSNTDDDRQKTAKKRFALVMHLIKDKYQDPYFSEMMYGIESELQQHGYALDYTFEIQDIFTSDLFASLNKDNLGIICVGPLKSDFLYQLKKQVPSVFSVGGLLLPEIDCVTIDFKRAAHEIVQHLIQLGHRSISFIGGHSRVGESLEQERRFLGFKEAMEANALPLVANWILDGGYCPTKSYEEMVKILQSEERPTAVFTASDKMAYGVYKAIQEAGLSIPEDLSVVSFDNIELAEYMNPGLTTVRVHKEAMGRIAVKLMLQRMEGILPLHLNILLPTELIYRDSSRELSQEG
ncbi:LacI family DNA-binding transcriptional regulator [Paenibacillus chungangensis]|uniref:LacI family DNA-binding transcriptional regulator n=1 Tax=Paenibacillus chungangensis TaxID=696535 RepID=A0ABW3HR55_9BACL